MQEQEDISTSSERESPRPSQQVGGSQPTAAKQGATSSSKIEPEPEVCVADPEISRMKVFFGRTFPKANKFAIDDPAHPLNSRNLVYDESTKTVHEVRCFERPGIHFFGQRVLSNGDVFAITPVSPFYLLLPYLWSDLRYNEEKGGKASLKSVHDLLLEDRSQHKTPYNLKPLNAKLKQIFTDTMEKCVPFLRATCVVQEAGQDVYIKLDRTKLLSYLKTKSEQLAAYVLDQGQLLEYSLLKKQFKTKDAQEFALEHISSMVSAEVFSALVVELGLSEAELFKKDPGMQKVTAASPDLKEARTKPHPGSKSPLRKDKAAPAPSGKGTITGFFAKKN